MTVPTQSDINRGHFLRRRYDTGRVRRGGRRAAGDRGTAAYRGVHGVVQLQSLGNGFAKFAFSMSR